MIDSFYLFLEILPRYSPVKIFLILKTFPIYLLLSP
jgi:hypothetical protein